MVKDNLCYCKYGLKNGCSLNMVKDNECFRNSRIPLVKKHVFLKLLIQYCEDRNE